MRQYDPKYHTAEHIITPCSGEHVARTAEIGTVSINTWKMVSDSVVRLTFKVSMSPL